MTIKTETTVTFTAEDRAVLLAMHDWVDALNCTSMNCYRCPFQSFCEACHSHSTPDEALENIKEAIIDAIEN